MTALFAPEPGRANLMALYAFNLEVSRTREQVSEPMIGEIRLQWWREALEAIEKGSPPEHEVVQALAKAINETGLKRDLLDRLINARSFDLYDEPMQTTEDLISYLKETSSVLMEAGATLLSKQDDPLIRTLVENAGIAWGLTGVLRALPIHIERNQQFLPQDLLERHGLTWNQISNDKEADKIRPAADELIRMARKHIQEAKVAFRKSDRYLRPVIMPSALAEAYLRDINKSGFNPCTSTPDVPVFRKQLTMMKVALLGRL